MKEIVFFAKHLNLIFSLFICFLFFYSVLCFAQLQTSPGTPWKNILVDVYLNEVDTKDVALCLQYGDDLLVSSSNLSKWHIMLPKVKVMSYSGYDYYSLKSFPDLKYFIDYEKMNLNLSVPAKYFSTENIGLNGKFIKPDVPANGAYLNYDVNYQNQSSNNDLSALLTAGLFNKLGTGIGDFLAKYDHNNDNWDKINNGSDNYSKIIRLNTYWQVDYPERMNSLIIGDYFSTPGMWGKSTDIGGLHFGTNFETQPYFVTFPSPTFRGDATAPTSVDLYVNNALVGSKGVNAGPFDVTSIPVITGQGNLKVVTTDLLGRQQVVTIPYYASSSLLKSGLKDYAVETGFIRRNYGIDSSDYARFAAVGNYREGVTDNLTGELRAEVVDKQQDLGLGASYLVNNFGILSIAASASNNSSHLGGLFSIGFQRQTQQQINFGFNTEITSHDFTQLGLDEDQLAPSLINQFFVSKTFLDGSSVGVAYTQQNNRDYYYYQGGVKNYYENNTISLLSASYSRNLWHSWFMGITGQFDLERHNNNAVYLTISKQIAKSTSLSITGADNKDNYQGTVRLTRYLPVGTGYGYDIYLNQGQSDVKNYHATVSAQNSIGTYSAGVALDSSNELAYKLEASGSAVFIGDRPYLMRNIGSSFGLVQIPGYPNVGVYLENHLVDKTDRNGNLLVPRLNSYEKNQITIDPNDLPVDTEIGGTKINAVPYFRSGEIINFPIKPSNAVTLKLKLPSGESAPLGAQIKINDQVTDLFVADDGFVYLKGLDRENKISVIWDGQQCVFYVHYEHDKKNPIPDLGEIICNMVK